MEIRIFDVAHGFCALVTDDDGTRMLVDCGHNNLCNFYPSDHLAGCGCTGVHRFFVTNYDEDHVSGLPRLRQLGHRMPIEWLHRNRTLSQEQLRAMKRISGGVGPGMSSLLDMIDTYTGEETPLTAGVARPSLLTYRTFGNLYPQFDDTNNLSLVLFVHYPGISIVFPGDLEKAGWQQLLLDPAFRAELSGVNIFVASHHGRESGYLREIFDYCIPSVVIISDEAMRFDTQDHCYAQHATGITWNQSQQRYVLTTRCDGDLVITPNAGGFYISASR